MRFMTSALVVAAVLAAGPVGVHARELCAAKVLEAELLPYAPIGSWLATATLEVRTSNAPTSFVTIREALPWQTTIRRGEVFQVDCQQVSRNGLSLAALAAAPSFRSFGARSSNYARVR
jgi:hypothetical protein